MFRLFSSEPTPSTRFSKCTEFKEIFSLLDAIRAKQASFEATAATYGAATIEYSKSVILKQLLTMIDDHIAKFNASIAPYNATNANTDMTLFIRHLRAIANQTIQTHHTILNYERNYHKARVKTAIRLGSVVGGIATTVMLPMSLFWSAATILGSGYAGYFASDIASSVNESTVSYKLVYDLHNVLIRIESNLQLPIIRMIENAPAQNGSDNSRLVARQSQSSARNTNAQVDETRYSAYMQDYLNGINHTEVTNSSLLQTLIQQSPLSQQEQSILEGVGCDDPITCTVMDVPVLLNEKYYDVTTLLNILERDQRDPFSRHHFSMRDIQPAREKREAIKVALERIRTERAQQVVPVAVISESVRGAPSV